MASPFLKNPVEIRAQIIRRALRREITFKDRHNPLAFPDEHLYERYRFSSRALKISHAEATHLMYRKLYVIALWFFASGTYLHAVGDAENIIKYSACRTIRKVVIALQEYIDVLIVFPGHLETLGMKEGFYKIAGKIISNAAYLC